MSKDANSGLWRGVVLVALVLGVLSCMVAWGVEREQVGEWGLPLDDSWIHCTIARNLVEGHGWSYNPGVPIQNSSGPLWTALVTLGFLLFGVTVWVPKVLGALCFLGCVYESSRLARRLTRDRFAGATAALCTALSAPFLWHGLSGMETPLAALLVTLGLDLFYTFPVGRKRLLWALPVALAGMTRPETLILAPLLAGEIVLRCNRDSHPGVHNALSNREALGQAARPLVGVVVILLPYLLLNLSLSGSPFPSTFAAKVGDTGLMAALEHKDPWGATVSLTLGAYIWSVFTLAYWGCTNVALLFLAGLGVRGMAMAPVRALAPAALLLGLPLLRGIVAPHATPEIHHGRYVACLFPTFFACAGVGLAFVLRDPTRLALRNLRFRLVCVFLATLALASLLRLELRVPHLGPGPLGALLLVVPGIVVERPLGVGLLLERVGLVVSILGLGLAVGLRALGKGIWRSAGIALVVAATTIQLWRLVEMPDLYARNVRDIHRMDVALGRWIESRVPPNVPVVVNDIGATAFFGRRPVIDAVGLATPELVPFHSRNNLRKLGALRHLRPRVFAIFPSWFPQWPKRPSLLQPIHNIRVENRTIIGSDLAVVYLADWDRFSRYYTDELLARLDPPEKDSSLRGHWGRALRNMQIPNRSRLYAKAGDLSRDRSPSVAQRNYLRALECNPRSGGAWAGLLKLYLQTNDEARYVRTVERVAETYPNSSDAQERLADLRAGQGRLDEARLGYDVALELHPDGIRLLRKLEAFWTELGDLDRAQDYRLRLEDLEDE